MRNSRNTKITVIIALIISLVGLTLGFAAFSNTLTISSAANIKPDYESFKVQFSSDATNIITDSVYGYSSTGAKSGTAIINGTEISNLTAGFTGPGQSVTYTFYAHNLGEYEAYLKKIDFENIQNDSVPKKCIAKDASNTSETLMNSACADICVTIKVGDTETTTSIDNISGHKLPKKTSEKVTVTITYQNNNHNSDGDFDVAFGDVSLIYSSAA